MQHQDPLGMTNWRQVAIAALAQNVATGLAFGSFGTLVLAIEQEYHASRSLSSLTLSLMVVTLAATATLLGRLLETIPIRIVMQAGAALAATAFALASVAQTSVQLLAIYMLLLGPATAMLGVLPSMTLASRWSAERNRGVALGIVNMPLMVMIVPLAIAPILESADIRTVYRVLAAVDLSLIPVLWLVRNKPLTPELASHAPAVIAPRRIGAAKILGTPALWLIILAVGIIAGAGTAKLAHFVPLLIGQGRTFSEANFLLALSGGAGLLGSFIFGALADRIGGTRAMLYNAVVQAATWTVFLAPVSMPILVVDAVIVGACGGGVQACLGVALIALFGSQNFSRVLGFTSLFTLPLVFGLTPMTSLLFEASGGYHLPMGALIGAFLIAAAALGSLVRDERRAMAVAREENA